MILYGFIATAQNTSFVSTTLVFVKSAVLSVSVGFRQSA
jgi:hypothetical protein